MAYDPDFIAGSHLPLPVLGSQLANSAFNGGAPVDHTRFSLVFSETRGFAIYTAHNIDGATLIPEGDIPRVNNFRLDPSVPRGFQVDNDRGYSNNPWDRGHLVRRRSLHWGERVEAEIADSESFFWTNITPQHEHLHDTAWGSIEDWMLTLADEARRRAVVMTGPVLTPDDPVIVNHPGEVPVQIPAGFWKIIAVVSDDDLRAAGFLVWQRDFDDADPVTFDPVLEQVRITTIEYLTGLSFGNLRELDPLRFGEPARTRATTRAVTPRPFAIDSRDDIVL